jgi:hypothetical protein
MLKEAYPNLSKIASPLTPAEQVLIAGGSPVVGGALGTAIGGTLGLFGPKEHKTESIGRGAVRGAGAGVGYGLGTALSAIARSNINMNPKLALLLHMAAKLGGGFGGDYVARQIIGKPSWQDTEDANTAEENN